MLYIGLHHINIDAEILSLNTMKNNKTKIDHYSDQSGICPVCKVISLTNLIQSNLESIVRLNDMFDEIDQFTFRSLFDRMTFIENDNGQEIILPFMKSLLAAKYQIEILEYYLTDQIKKENNKDQIEYIGFAEYLFKDKSISNLDKKHSEDISALKLETELTMYSIINGIRKEREKFQ